MTAEQFDAIVVGGGMAGVACAGELVVQGARPLLLCETSNVGMVGAATEVAGRWAFSQFPVRQIGAGGGWWYNLARALNAKIHVHTPMTRLAMTIRGSGEVHGLPQCVSAGALTDTIAQLLPLPIDDVRDEFERIIQAALDIPFATLMTMHEVPVGAWLEEQRADPLVAMLLSTFCGYMFCVPPQEAGNIVSMHGGFGYIRAWMCAEALAPGISPDPQRGLMMPLAEAIEHKGGVVWRNTPVAHVLTEGDSAVGVVLKDGQEVRAPIVAIATGNARIRKLLDPLPPELEAPLTPISSSVQDLRDFNTTALLEAPRDKTDAWTDCFVFVANPDISLSQLAWPLDKFAPWVVGPGQQMVLSEIFLPTAQVEKEGGEEAVFARMHEINNEVFPGYTDSIVGIVNEHKKYSWLAGAFVGPKLPRRTESLDNLWFVGEGSFPVGAVPGMEAAASAGILGARQITKHHKGLCDR